MAVVIISRAQTAIFTLLLLCNDHSSATRYLRRHGKDNKGKKRPSPTSSPDDDNNNRNGSVTARKSSSAAGSVPAFDARESPEDRNRRWVQRLGTDLKVTSVDARFSSRIRPAPTCAPDGCLPDFITIGAQKGGTTSLYHYLLSYCPEGIVTSKREELNFFTERYAQKNGQGLRWLRQQFPSKSSTMLRGYKSPNYLPHPLVPYRLKRVLPRVKLVLLLREPVSRAVSAYAMGLENGRESGRRSAEEALSSELSSLRRCLARASSASSSSSSSSLVAASPSEALSYPPTSSSSSSESPQRQRRRPRLACLWDTFYPGWDSPGGLPRDSWQGMTGPNGAYLAPGLYALQLRHWLRSFPLDSFFVASSKSFSENTAHEMRRLVTFLQKGRPPSAAALKVNEKVLASRHRTKKKGSGSSSSSRQGLTSLSGGLKADLRAFFAPFNEELWGILGRELAW